MSKIIKPRVPSLNSKNPLARGILYDFPLFEGSGTITTEIVTKVPGTFQGTAPTWDNDLYGKVLNFGGAGYVGWPTGFDITNGVFSIVSLIKPTGVASNQAILGSNANSGIEFRINTSGQLDLLAENVVDMGQSTGVLSANVWSMVGVTYDTSGNFIFYINGLKSGSGTNLQTFVSFTPQIGVNQHSNNEFFSGKIAFLHFWRRVLSPQEMKQHSINPFAIYTWSPFPYANSIAAASKRLLALLGAG